MTNSIYNYIYFIGIQTIRYFKRFQKGFKELLLRPLRAFAAIIFTAIIVIDKFTLKTFHEITADVKSLFSNTNRVVSEWRADSNGKKTEHIKKIPSYAQKMWTLYKHVFVYAGNHILPIACAVIMLNVIYFWADTTFALELNYNGKVIGYVKSEAVYKDARHQAMDRLQVSTVSATTDEGEKNEVIGNAEYSLKRVKLSRINDASTICDSLIENSDCNITNACGIYIDGDFLCAVKNETDALAVFDGILADYDAPSDATVSFVEEISYVQGLYPDDEKTVWDAEQLSKKLSSKKSEARYYTVQVGDTVSQIAQKNGVSTTEIFALNPSLKESIYVGQKILLEGDVNFVQVQVTKTEIHTEKIPYSTIKVNTDTLYIGDKKTVVKGQNGEQLVTSLVTYIDGVRVSSKEISRVTTKQVVDEKIQVGTKHNYYSSYGGYSGSTGGYYNNYTGAKLGWPGVGCSVVSSGYGRRNFGRGWHGGVDLCRPGGTMGAPVVAAESGRVVAAGYESMGGYYVRIDHGNGLQTLYAHMRPGSLCVRTGQYVRRGQQIGQAGASGYVTGAHLHFEVRVNGTKVNPLPYIR